MWDFPASTATRSPPSPDRRALEGAPPHRPHGVWTAQGRPASTRGRLRCASDQAGAPGQAGGHASDPTARARRESMSPPENGSDGGALAVNEPALGRMVLSLSGADVVALVLIATIYVVAAK